MKIDKTETEKTAHEIWAEWSPRAKKKPIKLTHVTSAIVLVASSLQFASTGLV